MFKAKTDLSKLNLHRILIIRLSALGDTALTLPILAALKAKNYFVGWVTQEDYAPILQNHPQLDKLYLVPWRKWQAKTCPLTRCIKEYLDLIKQLREDRYDLVIDAQGLFKSWIFTLNTKIPWHIASSDAREGARWLATHLVDLKRDYYAQVVNLPQKFLSLLTPLGLYLGRNLNAAECAPQLPLLDTLNTSFSSNEINNTFCAWRDKTRPLIIIAPCTTRLNKFLAPANWRQLLSKLPQDAQIVLTGQAKDLDYLKSLARPWDLMLAGKTTLNDLRRLMELSHLVISVDSGSAHLAWATQKPKLIVIYASTSCITYDLDPEKSAIKQQEGNLLSWHQNNYWTFTRQLPCQPCKRRRCPLVASQPPCGQKFNTEFIAKVATQLLSAHQD